jgi:signal transduction histidine kinase
MALGEIKENLDVAADGTSPTADGTSAAAAGTGAAAGGDDDPGRTRALVGAAHSNAKDILAELRDLARGIHPPVLDRGLQAALSALAETSAIPVRLTANIAERPSPAIETIAYFCAAELLANATKHSGATRAAISATDADGKLLMTVADDGAGEARLVLGGGLAGLVERVQTVDGRLCLASPPGGPTVVTIELPGHA